MTLEWDGNNCPDCACALRRGERTAPTRSVGARVSQSLRIASQNRELISVPFLGGAMWHIDRRSRGAHALRCTGSAAHAAPKTGDRMQLQPWFESSSPRGRP